MRLLRIILFPLALLYGVIVYLRNLLYDKEIFKSTRFDTPTICVGNIALGGTGKTPMIELLIKYYVAKGKKVVVLSRGYGRATKGLIHAEPTSSPADIGDEPKQLLEAFPMIDIVVCADRVHAMQYVEKKIKPDLVLLDDAFQHRAIKAQFNILLTTYNKPYFNDFYLPAGTLRDHQLRVKKAQVVVVTKSPDHIDATKKASFVSGLNLMPNQPVFFSHLKYDNILVGLNKSISLNNLKGQEITLVTAIANPEPLVCFLEKQGIIIHHLRYADHHYFSRNEIESLKKHQKIICTHKDFVKLSTAIPQLFYLPVSHDFIEREKHIFYRALPEIRANNRTLYSSSSS